jgi:Bacterial extracellular solute-binding proteins, family 3
MAKKDLPPSPPNLDFPLSERPELNFKRSKQLRAVFLEEFERWSKKHRAGMSELAARCGLSQTYLSQVGRYGRVPSKSALILLALHFELNDPRKLFQAAGILEPWPLDDGLMLRKKGPTEESFLTLHLDMDGMMRSVREIVRAEIKPRSIRDLTLGRPLRVGINPLTEWHVKGAGGSGFFQELCDMLALSLQCGIESYEVPYANYEEMFKRGDLDLYGPLLSAPTLADGANFSAALYRVGISALMRVREHPDLKTLSVPKNVKELANGDYEIAVLRHGRAHLICNTLLKRTDSQLILCDSHDEAFERVTLKGVRRGAHLFLVNSVVANDYATRKEVRLLFDEPKSMIDYSDVSIAARADWPELITHLNECIMFLSQTGALEGCLDKWLPEEYRRFIQPAYPQVKLGESLRKLKVNGR